jgi:catechol 2,3-dioxygenase-like lactoylglutathione lyase family enzyme
MSYLATTHIAIAVPGALRDAEAYYRDLFGLAVSWREPVPADAPFDLPWQALDAVGVAPEIVMLHSGAFRLSVVADGAARGRGVIDHVGLQVDRETLDAVRERAIGAGLQVVADREGELFDFVDRFGVEWELDTRSFDEPLAIVMQKRKREAAAKGAR